MESNVKRPRPYQPYSDIYPDEIDNGNCFPSGHTSVVFAAAASIALTGKKWYFTLPGFAWATGVGYSRIYLGQHYPSDVLAGAVLVLRGLMQVIGRIRNSLQRKSNKPPTTLYEYYP